MPSSQLAFALPNTTAPTADTALANQTDPLLREIAALKLASVNAQIDTLAAGTVVFAGTETWRAVYEQLLAGGNIREYRSVAWVRNADDWRDSPGRQSMRANFEAAHRGVLIERIAILPDAIWPDDRSLPVDVIRPWLQEQHDHGLHVVLVRESALDGDRVRRRHHPPVHARIPLAAG